MSDPALTTSETELRPLVERALSTSYELDREIGRGGMGIVYRAKDRRLKRPVAIKLLPPELAFRSEIRTRFLREVWRYVTARKGLLTLSAAHVAAFCRSRPDLSGPDIQFHILPASAAEPDGDAQDMTLEKEPGLTIAPCQLRVQRLDAHQLPRSHPRHSLRHPVHDTRRVRTRRAPGPAAERRS